MADFCGPDVGGLITVPAYVFNSVADYNNVWWRDLGGWNWRGSYSPRPMRAAVRAFLNFYCFVLSYLP